MLTFKILFGSYLFNFTLQALKAVWVWFAYMVGMWAFGQEVGQAWEIVLSWMYLRNHKVWAESWTSLGNGLVLDVSQTP